VDSCSASNPDTSQSRAVKVVHYRMLTRRRFVSALAIGAAGLSSGGPELRAVQLSGLDFIHRNSPTSQKYVIETMCGGVALFDYNNDGRLDDPVKLPARFGRRARTSAYATKTKIY
jgi:hypothetical protein